MSHILKLNLALWFVVPTFMTALKCMNYLHLVFVQNIRKYLIINLLNEITHINQSVSNCDLYLILSS